MTPFDPGRRRALAVIAGGLMATTSLAGAGAQSGPLSLAVTGVKWVGQNLNATLSVVINHLGFVWQGTLGGLQVAIGKSKTFIRNVAGLAFEITMWALEKQVRFAVKVSGFGWTLTKSIIKNL